MTLVFLKFQTKNTQIRHRQSKIQAFSIFRETLQFDKFEDDDFKYDHIVFKFHSRNIQIKHFWSLLQAFLFFSAKFCKQTNLRVLFSNMNIVFEKLFPKNTKIRHFRLKIPESGVFGQILRDCCSFTKFCNQTNSNVLLSNMTIVF